MAAAAFQTVIAGAAVEPGREADASGNPDVVVAVATLTDNSGAWERFAGFPDIAQYLVSQT